MGLDHISPEEVTEVLGLSYREEQLSLLDETLPDRGTLACLWGSGYTLIPAPPEDVGFRQIHERNPGFFAPYMDTESLFSCCDVVSAGTWVAIQKEASKRTRKKTWREQQLNIMDRVEYVPNIAQLCWAVTMYRQVRGRLLLRESYSGSSSIVAGVRLYASHLGVRGTPYWTHSHGEYPPRFPSYDSQLHIFGAEWEKGRYPDVGIASGWRI